MKSLLVWTHGLVDSGCVRQGDPPLIHWLTIQPDGQLARHETPNEQGVLPGIDRWAQWNLIHAVRTAIAPPAAEDTNRRAQVFDLHAAGVVIASHPYPGDGARPFNTLAAAMVTTLNHSVSSWWPLRDTVAWLGAVSEMDGPHASLTDEQLTALEALAGSLRLREAARPGG
jgi:hypothetical protein